MRYRWWPPGSKAAGHRLSFAVDRIFQKLHLFVVVATTALFLLWIVMTFKLVLLQQKVEFTPARILSLTHSPPGITVPTEGNNSVYENTTSTKTRGHQRTCSSSKMSIEDLAEEQRNPTVGKRWMVRPPPGGSLHLMCCDTTKGPFRVLLHERWAPIGVRHLLDMLEGGYFEAGIPLFRCTDACQFGLSSDAALTARFGRSVPDDPLWLPTGPRHRFSSGADGNGRIERYPKGVLTHAGFGKDSRGVQFVLTLKPNRFMGGGSPWEVPLGEVVEVGGGTSRNNGEDRDFADVSLPDIYTGYGEKGPSQGLLSREGASKSVREKWPLLDYVLRCSIVDQFLEQ